MTLTVTEKLRTLRPAGSRTPAPVFGRLEQAGEVRATFYRFPLGGLSVTSLTHEDTLAAHLVSIGQSLPSVSADHHTATAFTEAWQRHTGATPTLRVRLHLHRLGTLTPPEPTPAGRGRLVGERDHEHLMRWCREFAADVGEAVTNDAAAWPGTRFAEKRSTFWETPDGTPVSMAGVNPMVAGQVRVDPVYTPAHQRGRGYAGAVTAEVSRAALAAGATDVVLFTNAANPTSNALYRRIGYVPIANWAAYDFTSPEPEASQNDRSRGPESKKCEDYAEFREACLRCPMLNINPKMLPRLDEIEVDLLTRRARAEHEAWLGEVEGIDLTLTFLRQKRQETKRLAHIAPVDLGMPAVASPR